MGLKSALPSEAAESAKVESIKEWLGTSLYRNSFSLMLAAGLASGLSLLFWIVVARLAPPAEVGLATALLAAGMLVSFIGSLGLGYSLIRYIPTSGPHSSALVNSALTLSAGMAALVSLIFLAGLGFWSPPLLVVGQQPLFVGAFVTFVVAATAGNIVDMSFVSFRRASLALARTAIFDLGKLFLAPFLAVALGALGIFASLSLASMGSIGVALLFLLPMASPDYRFGPRLRWPQVKEMASFSLVNQVGEGLWNAPGWLLPISMVNLFGAQANAFFYVCWAVAALLPAMGRATSTALFAEGSHRPGRLSAALRRSLGLTLLLVVPSIAALFLAGDKLLSVFGQAYAEEGAQLLRVLALGALPASLNLLGLGVARVRHDWLAMVGIPGLAAVVTMGLAILLSPSLGTLGPGLGWLAGHSLTAVVFGPQLFRALRDRAD